MTPAFSARRRADEFEALVSRSPDGPPDERSLDRYGDLLTLVGDLRAVPGPTPRPDFVASLREQLMAEADTVLVRTPLPSSPQQKLALPVRSRDRRFAAVLGSAAMVGATATVAVAAQTALPGESLYPVKRAMEAAEHRLASDDAALGRSLLGSAERRLTELEALAAEDRTGADNLIPDTLDQFSEQSEDGARSLLDAYDQTGDTTAVADLRDFTATSMDRLVEMESTLPSSARDELLAAGRRLSDLDAAAAVACPACGGGIAEVPDFLLTPVASRDLLVGLDRDRVQLDPAPVSGQDVTGIEVPEALQVPTDQVTDAPVATPQGPATGGTGSTGGTAGTGGAEDSGQGGVKDTVKNGAEDTVKDTTGTVTGTTDAVGETLDETTGGAVGGLTGELDDATEGLIGDVTGAVPQPAAPEVELP